MSAEERLGSVQTFLSKNLDDYKIECSDAIILSENESNVLAMELNFMMPPIVIDRLSIKTALNGLSRIDLT
ncbi:hypothetical protein GJ496_011595 [Pomphorhynchus laevis]|nr:hypothetical protein GJ496_011593 [Pomphorhynchus laevis]KAI0988096.1 hypothetical protein GJ496_011595 [Pomphorhynchus laevis]